jgi:phosphoribosylanthranilate isomerase
MTWIKICGLTSVEDALAAAAAGADAIGLVFAESPRQVTLPVAARMVGALAPKVSTVGVFVDADIDEVAATADRLGLTFVQLHGSESPTACAQPACKVIKRFDIHENDTPASLRQRMQRYRVAAYLLDPGAGSGRTFDWRLADGLPEPLIVSGGLTPTNVGEAIQAVRPFGVDVSSGVESAPGHKDPAKVAAFVQAVRNVDASINSD